MLVAGLWLAVELSPSPWLSMSHLARTLGPGDLLNGCLKIPPDEWALHLMLVADGDVANRLACAGQHSARVG